jgi:F-type H+-transporting ATPase subunit gamma
MPSLKAIRKRIGTVKNTQKITRAMKMVAAARLRRAQDAIVSARPYSNELERVVSDLAGAIGPLGHPLMVQRPIKHCTIVVMSSDRGLAGAFNSALIRSVERFLAGDMKGVARVDLRIIGRKGRDYFRRTGGNILSFQEAPVGATALDFAHGMAHQLVSDYLEEKTDCVYLAYNAFKAPGSQDVLVRKILPISPNVKAESGNDNFLFEPSKEELLEHVLPLYIQNGLLRAALESIASELGARMAAMDAATRNAGEIISRMTLQYNRARQAAITKELLEIISGAEALKG